MSNFRRKLRISDAFTRTSMTPHKGEGKVLSNVGLVKTRNSQPITLTESLNCSCQYYDSDACMRAHDSLSFLSHIEGYLHLHQVARGSRDPAGLFETSLELRLTVVKRMEIKATPSFCRRFSCESTRIRNWKEHKIVHRPISAVSKNVVMGRYIYFRCSLSRYVGEIFTKQFFL